jgi:hypothetical protein
LRPPAPAAPHSSGEKAVLLVSTSALREGTPPLFFAE